MNRKKISERLKEKVRQAAKYRCGYCLFQMIYSHTTFEIDHIIPVSQGGATVEENLWLACEICNSAKTDKIEGFDSVTKSTFLLFNPRTQNWNEHFEWSDNFTKIVGKTPIGRATVTELNLNKERIVGIRKNWVAVGWHPPED